MYLPPLKTVGSPPINYCFENNFIQNMNCVLCLKVPLDLSEVLDINSAEGLLLNVKNVIQKHFWLQESDISDALIICHSCWGSVLAFHNFYLRVQSAHNALESKTGVPADWDAPLDIALSDRVETESIEEPAPKRRRKQPPNVKRDVANSDMKSENEHDDIDNDNQIHFKSEKNEALQEDLINVRSLLIEDEEQNHFEPEAKNPKKRSAGCKRKAEPNKSKSPNLQSITISRFDEYIAKHFKLICSLCEAPCTDFMALKDHFRNEHGTLGYATCCSKKFFKRAIFVDHLHLHEDPHYFKCPHCDKPMGCRRSFETHVKHHEESDTTYKCDVCSKHFRRMSSLKIHETLHIPEEQKEEQCPDCGKRFAIKYMMNQHRRIVHLNWYKQICDICGKSILGKEDLKLHLEEHKGIKPLGLECDLCGVTLFSKRALWQHKYKMHIEKDAKSLTCSFCSKISPSLAAHKAHIRFVHTDERKYACQMCDKAFKRSLQLKEHIATHTGELLYNCSHCPKGFKTHTNMYMHTKKEHPKVWEESRKSRYHMARKPKDIVIKNLTTK